MVLNVVVTLVVYIEQSSDNLGAINIVSFKVTVMYLLLQ